MTPEDRKFIERLQAAIADPAATPEQREEIREELGCICHSYVVTNHLDNDEDTPEARPTVANEGA